MAPNGYVDNALYNSAKSQLDEVLALIDQFDDNQTVSACERAEIMNIGSFKDAVFNLTNAFLADKNQQFVAEVEAIELE